VAKKRYRASKRDGVAYKINECRFFLAEMVEREKQRERHQEFGYCLSAFLSAFRSVGYRLNGILGNARTKVLERELELLHPDIWFLLDMRNFEVHGDGPTVWPRFTLTISPGSGRWASRWSRRARPAFAASRFRPRLSTEGIKTKIIGWLFEGHPKDVIDLCRESLDRLEDVARRELGNEQ
jgi:hypothetical protein